MKIPESIIKKYQLTATSNHVGEAVVHNLQVFKSGLPGFEGVWFMECDLTGKPSKYITLYNKKTTWYLSATPEYLNTMAIIDILKSVV